MSKEVDTTKYDKLLDPNRETAKIKVEFLKDISTHKAGDKRILTTEEYQLYSERGYCKSAEKPTQPTLPAFEWFDKIDGLEKVEDKHRAILKQYEGLNISRAYDGKHKMKWATEPVEYKDEIFSANINMIGRKKDRLVLEFDEVKCEPGNPRENLEKLKLVLQHYGIGYIQTTHGSKNSDYLWIEFDREILEEEAQQFVSWIAPEGSNIDLNFCFDKKVFPVMFAEHWKYPKVRELPTGSSKGRKINFDALKLPNQKIEKRTFVGKDGFEYITHMKRRALPKVKIAGSGLLMSEIAENIASVFSEKETLFYKQEIREIVEVSKIKHDEDDKSFLGFSVIKPKRFITLSENHFNPYTCEKVQNEETGKADFEEVDKSMTNEKAAIVLASPHFQEAMPVIKRIFSIPLPMMYEGKLTFPKTGYDKRFYSWLNPNAPTIDYDGMDVEDAKIIMEKMFMEFCFEKEQDYTNAIAGLITPFLRGMFPDFTTRTPMFFYVANRERAGKDYLASLTGLVLEGQALDEPPISDGDNNNKNDELRKKLLSCVLQGRRRLHFANNKGRINNSVLEATLTSRRISDRLLGKNEVVSVDNELDFSASGNVGITFTPDLSNRCVFVKLFLDIEDANKRSFDRPDLHGWVVKNRGKILSAIYCLINDWVEKGCVEGKEKFTSYPEWAAICGGIMENAGFGSPCIPNDDALVIGGDTESREMKRLFELCYEICPERPMKKTEIIDIIKSDGELFAYFDWEKNGDRVKFGLKIVEFYGRVFSGIRLVVTNPEARTHRHLLMVTKASPVDGFKVGMVGMVGRVLTPTPTKHNINNINSKNVLDGLRPYQPYQEPLFTRKNEKNVVGLNNDLSQKIELCPKCNSPMIENRCIDEGCGGVAE